MVPLVGFEPTRLSPFDLKSNVFANFTTARIISRNKWQQKAN